MQELLFSSIKGQEKLRTPEAPATGCNYRLLAANIQNPGAERATKLMEWLAEEAFDILVLSELQPKPACHNLVSELRALGYQTTLLDSTVARSYHTVVASRVCFEEMAVVTPTLHGRVRVTRFRAEKSELILVGVYGITFNERNADQRKLYKADFETRILHRLAGVRSAVIIVGDLNIVEPNFHDHIAGQVADDKGHYLRFGDFGFADLLRTAYPNSPEYTWFSPRSFEGQRLDHIFAGEANKGWLSNISVCHKIRQAKLSDHSAIEATLTFPVE